MKNFTYIGVLAFLLMAVTVTGYGQVLTERASGSLQDRDLQAKFKSSPDVIDFAPIGAMEVYKASLETGSKNNGPSAGSDGQRFAPGQTPLFIPRVNNEFYSHGDTLDLVLVSMMNTSRNLTGVIQVLKPGVDGQYDGTIPASYAQLGPNGMIKSPETFERIPIYSRKFSEDDPNGRWAYNIVIYDAETDRLLQQIILEVYLVDAGRWGRIYYARFAYTTETGMKLIGRFPPNTPIYYLIGADSGYVMTGSDPQYAGYSDGSSLVVNGRLNFNRTTSVSIWAWSPYTRYAFVRKNVDAEEVQP